MKIKGSVHHTPDNKRYAWETFMSKIINVIFKETEKLSKATYDSQSFSKITALVSNMRYHITTSYDYYREYDNSIIYVISGKNLKAEIKKRNDYLKRIHRDQKYKKIRTDREEILNEQFYFVHFSKKHTGFLATQTINYNVGRWTHYYTMQPLKYIGHRFEIYSPGSFYYENYHNNLLELVLFDKISNYRRRIIVHSGLAELYGCDEFIHKIKTDMSYVYDIPIELISIDSYEIRCWHNSVISACNKVVETKGYKYWTSHTSLDIIW